MKIIRNPRCDRPCQSCKSVLLVEGWRPSVVKGALETSCPTSLERGHRTLSGAQARFSGTLLSTGALRVATYVEYLTWRIPSSSTHLLT
jgi:hypothetical protein